MAVYVTTETDKTDALTAAWPASGKRWPQGSAWRDGWDAAVAALGPDANPYKVPEDGPNGPKKTARAFANAWDRGYAAQQALVAKLST